MITDSVVAILDRIALSAILPIVHAHGFGHVARVLSAERGDLRSQLKRVGVPSEGAPRTVLDAGTVLVLSAAARSPAAGGLLIRSGATQVWTATHRGEWNVFDDSVTVLSPAPPVRGAVPQSVPGLHDALPSTPSTPDEHGVSDQPPS